MALLLSSPTLERSINDLRASGTAGATAVEALETAYKGGVREKIRDALANCAVVARKNAVKAALGFSIGAAFIDEPPDPAPVTPPPVAPPCRCSSWSAPVLLRCVSSQHAGALPSGP